MRVVVALASVAAGVQVGVGATVGVEVGSGVDVGAEVTVGIATGMVGCTVGAGVGGAQPAIITLNRVKSANALSEMLFMVYLLQTLRVSKSP
jgi:hypothetical protein